MNANVSVWLSSRFGIYGEIQKTQKKISNGAGVRGVWETDKFEELFTNLGNFSFCVLKRAGLTR